MARIRLHAPGLSEMVLRPYARIIFSRDPAVGALVLLAIAVFPRVALATLLAVVVADATSLILGFGAESVREGGAACMAVLTTLATVVTLGQDTIALVILGAIFTVLLTMAIQTIFVRVSLPILSLPFVFSAWAVVLVARMTGASVAPLVRPTSWGFLPASAEQSGWLDVPAAILFSHGALAGALLLVAILWYSRIGVLLGGIGGAVAVLARSHFAPPGDWSPLDSTAAFNSVLTAMALGGVWFVPHPSAILLAALGGGLAALATYAMAPVVGVLSLPVLSLPFAFTTLGILAAMRMRENDRNPASAPAADTPEDALELHLMRVRRFGEFAWLPFRLPFRGPWIVTQGHLGRHTHQGPWRYAFDFEVADADGKTSEGAGSELRDYRCYNLPVLAAGAGTVDQVVDGIADNPIGGLNARDNWGNTVVIAHGSNLYSVAAHLKPRSITVKPGDLVKAGAEIGRCGNSGRSSVPHLHFQVQRGAVLGSETIPADFGDVVSQMDGVASVSHRVIPGEGAVVRPVVRDQTLAEALTFAAGSAWLLTDQDGHQETAWVEIDLWSRRVLRSERASLYFESYESGLVIVAFRGDHRSLLRHVLLAMARIPFDHEARLAWRDRVPRRLLAIRSWGLIDLLAMVAPRLTDVEVSYTSQRSERALAVTGTANNLATQAVLSLSDAPHRIEVTLAGVRTVVQLAPVQPQVAEKAL